MYVVCSLNALDDRQLAWSLTHQTSANKKLFTQNQNLLVPDNWMALFCPWNCVQKKGAVLKNGNSEIYTCMYHVHHMYDVRRLMLLMLFFNTFQLQCMYMYSFILERFWLYMYLIHGNYTVVLTLYIYILLSVKRRHKQWCRCIEETS